VTGYLLDTNVVSELRKRSPDVNVAAWYDGVRSVELHLSVLTLGEIRMGIERLRTKDTARARVLDEWLRGLLVMYSSRIVEVDVATADEWGRLNMPDQLPVVDGLLAATAKIRGWTLVSRNTPDLSAGGITVLDPFRPAA
jgi:predicted nucleic acid-binding protein